MKKESNKKQNRVTGGKNGRPSKLTAEIKQKVKELIELGMNYKDVCLSIGITEETFSQWRKKYSEFSELVDSANSKVKEISLKSIRVGEMRDWKAAAWRLERRWPDEYKEKKEIEVKDKPRLVLDVFEDDDDDK